MSSDSGSLEALLTENRRFAPPEGFRATAVVSTPDVYRRAEADREAYWAAWAGELDWFTPWTRVLRWQPPHAEWFVGGKLNAAHNCLDRHVEAGKADRPALIWEGEPGDTRVLTYSELRDEVSRFANVLKDLGVTPGDRVTIYLPMVPLLLISLSFMIAG
jgi:acetyl-CoA synthetase